MRTESKKSAELVKSIIMGEGEGQKLGAGDYMVEGIFRVKSANDASAEFKSSYVPSPVLTGSLPRS